VGDQPLAGNLPLAAAVIGNLQPQIQTDTPGFAGTQVNPEDPVRIGGEILAPVVHALNTETDLSQPRLEIQCAAVVLRCTREPVVKQQIAAVLIVAVASDLSAKHSSHCLRLKAAFALQLPAHLSQSAGVGFFRPAEVVTGSAG